ncbi:halocin C8-like domain-containing protein [Halococcus sp. IIIV-5B]|uniref:halocin C8-like domain-containing protein n=1 Tax=Halococcus sp. IIIV-5B TaxID=2321230 RepID=UPI000E72CA4B|nr:halocin C8-like domain-containing protein [Halococcus sp. IIIV-5B]RJT07584.1 hypothetical protein D3261_03045 [Halococcus sp. IIIV-5B]
MVDKPSRAEKRKDRKLNINRRSALKKVGAATSLAVTPFAISGGAAAASSSDIEELHGWRKWAAIWEAKHTESYSELRQYFEENTSKDFDSRNAKVFETTDDSGSKYKVVSFLADANVQPDPSGDYKKANIAIRLEDGSSTMGKATRTTVENGDPTQVTVYNIEDGAVVQDSSTIGIAEPSSDSSGSGDFTTQATAKCKGCKLLVKAACAIGCGAGTAAICVLAGVTTLVGGIACGAAAAAVCFVISEFGCNRGAPFICKRAKVRGKTLCKR